MAAVKKSNRANRTPDVPIGVSLSVPVDDQLELLLSAVRGKGEKRSSHEIIGSLIFHADRNPEAGG